MSLKDEILENLIRDRDEMEDDWDGQGSKQITEASLTQFTRFIKLFPEELLVNLSYGGCAWGHVNLEWIPENTKRVWVIFEGDKIWLVWNIDGESQSVELEFNDQIPAV